MYFIEGYWTQDRKTAPKNDLEFWGHSWQRHPITGNSRRPSCERGYVSLGTSIPEPPPCPFNISLQAPDSLLGSQSHLSQYQTHILSYAKARGLLKVNSTLEVLTFWKSSGSGQRKTNETVRLCQWGLSKAVTEWPWRPLWRSKCLH